MSPTSPPNRRTRRQTFVNWLAFFLAVGSIGGLSLAARAFELQTISTQGSGRATGYVESNKIVTIGDRTHVTWLDSDDTGFRVRVRTLDRVTGAWSDTVTLGNAQDNHGGPAITVDSEGYLHVVYYPHSGAFRYRKSLAPNDASAWTEEQLVGERLTYPSLVVGPDDTLYLVARTRETSAWGLDLYRKPKNGEWSAPTRLIQAGEAGYSHFQASLAWGPDHHTLHLSTRMYSDEPRWGYKVGYMKSTDFGDTWTTSDGDALALPTTKSTIDTIESIPHSQRDNYSSSSALRAGWLAVDANNVPHVLYNTMQPNGAFPPQAWLATPDGEGGWQKVLLNEKISALPAGWGMGTPGGISFTEDGRMALAIAAYQNNIGWGDPGTEIIVAISEDGGQTFSSQFLTTPNPDVPHWMPSMERATGFNEVDSLGILFTAGKAGSDNHALVSNQVHYVSLLGPQWNGVSGDINQDGVLFGDGTGPASADDLTAFVAGWGTSGLPGAFGSRESMLHGDVNFDGTVDLADVHQFRTLLREAGMPTKALARLFTSVPEPDHTMTLAIVVVAGLVVARRRRVRALAVCALGLLATLSVTARAAEPLDYRVNVSRHFATPDDAFWFQARATAIPNQRSATGSPPTMLLTMQPHGFRGTHNYKGIVSALTDDFGRTWQGPTPQKGLDIHTRPTRGDGRVIYEVPVDATPMHHPQSGKVLLTGATFQVDTKTNKDVPGGPSDVFYAVYDPEANQWRKWTTLQFPPSFQWPYKRSGCCQGLVEPNGDVLLPIYFGEHNNSIHYAAVARCTFDGEKLTYVEHGSEHKLDFGRGMSEPSLAKFRDQYFMTMRNDKGAYVSTSSDGLHFSEAEPWRFDDGEDLGSYNTQQHFLTHSDGLFLVYTRRGLDNDDVMRHRAPLVMAQIDPATKRVLRATERIVVPKEGTGELGNFGVCNITPNVSWIVVAKRITTPGEKNVFIAQIDWNRPNLLVSD